MDKSLEGKVILVTGSCGGIGSETARLLAAAGAKLLISDVDPAGARLADEICDAGGDCRFVRADLVKEDEVQALVESTVAAYGRIDGAFNNAGIETSGAELHEMALSDWKRIVDVDLTGVFLCMKYEIRAMLAVGGGAIVNTSSALGLYPWANSSDYVAAKHGVIGLTRAAALDYAQRGLRVNAVLPGAINTPMVKRVNSDPSMAGHVKKLMDHHAMGRFGEPIEIAEAVKWLLSDAASYVTGSALSVDGGFLVA